MALNSPAMIPLLDKSNKEIMALDYMQSQMTDLKMMVEMIMQERRKNNYRKNSISAVEQERLSDRLEKIVTGSFDAPEAYPACCISSMAESVNSSADICLPFTDVETWN